MAGHIDILSCGIGFPAGERLKLLEHADLVFGSRGLLSACPIPLRETREIGGTAREEAVAALAACRAGKHVVALASGDALYHGFGGTLASLATGESLLFHPDITAFQALFHRLGLAWQDIQLFSVHAGEAIPARQIAEAPFSVTYAGSRFSADALARAVLAVHPESASRPAVLAERLGSPDERIASGTLAEMAELRCGATSMLVLQRGEGAPELALGLPEPMYAREGNLITASDVRAVLLARLRLPAWGVLWDLGAGSGSVGLEAAALRPQLRVEAVERSAVRSQLIAQNVARLGVARYHVHTTEALAFIQTAEEAPDRIFLGGGGEAIGVLLSACMARLKPGGVLVASAVTLETFQTLVAWRPELRTDLCRVDIARAQTIAGRYAQLKPQNSIYIGTFVHP